MRVSAVVMGTAIAAFGLGLAGCSDSNDRMDYPSAPAYSGMHGNVSPGGNHGISNSGSMNDTRNDMGGYDGGGNVQGSMNGGSMGHGGGGSSGSGSAGTGSGGPGPK